MRRLVAVLMGLVLAVLVTGLALTILTRPLVTRVLAQRFSLAEEAGLPRERVLVIAEQVRSFVAGPPGQTLPAAVDGRPGFDLAAISHLADVRGVITAARLLTGGLVIVVAVWVWAEISRRRLDRIIEVMRAGAAWCFGLVVLGALAGVLDFETLFTAFHGLFFAEGTWTFSADSLLIQTFPEPFWATAAALWAGLVLLGSAALVLGAAALVNGRARPLPAHEDGSSTNGA